MENHPKDDRLTRAEEQIAHLARMVEDLSDIVARQHGDIDALRRRVERLVSREAERELDQGASIPIADQRPPHW
jgi:SlyX protein